MSIIIRLQNLPWSANSVDIRHFFSGLSIPEGGVHIVGGEMGDAFIAFSTDEDARLAMAKDGGKIKDMQIKLLLSSRTEMMRVIEQARQQNMVVAQPPVVPAQPPILALQQPARIVPSEADRRRGRSPSPHHRSRDRRRSPDDRRGSKRERSRSPSRSSRSFSRDMDRRGDRFKREDRRYDDSRYRDERRPVRDPPQEAKRYLDADNVNSRSQLHATEGFRNIPDVYEQNAAMRGLYPFLGQSQTGVKNFPEAFSHAPTDVSNKMPQTEPHKQADLPHLADQKQSAMYPQDKVPFRSSYEPPSTKEGSISQMDQQMHKPRRRTRFEPEFASSPAAPNVNAKPEGQQETPRDNFSQVANVWPRELTENMPWNEKRQALLNPPVSKNGDFLQVVPMDLDPSPSDMTPDKEIYQDSMSDAFGRNNASRDDDLRRDVQSRGLPRHDDKGNENRGPRMQNEVRGDSRGPPGRHNEIRGPAGRHNENRGPSGRHNDGRGPGRPNEGRGGPMPNNIQGRIPPSLTVEVRGLAPDARIEDILDLFHGIPLPAANVRIEASDQGFEKAIIRFVSVADFEEALNRNRRFMHEGRCELVPCPAAAFDSDPRSLKPKPKPKPREEDLTIQLRGLPFSCKDDDVVRFFDGLGILDLYVDIAPDGRASGVGFVEFGTAEDFRAALAMNGKMIGHRYITVSVASKEMMAFARGEEYDFQRKGAPYPHSSANQGRPLSSANQGRPLSSANQGRPLSAANQGRPLSATNQGRPLSSPGQIRPPLNQGRPPHPGNQGRGPPPPCVSMKGLPEGVTNRDIANFLGEMGIMPRAVHIMLRPDKTPSGDAFAEFGGPADLETALEMNGKPMLGKRVMIQPISFYEMSDILGRPSPMPPPPVPTALLRTPGDGERPRRPLLPQGPIRERPLLEPFKNHVESGRSYGSGRMRAPWPFNGGNRFPPPERGIKDFGSPGCVVSINNLHFRAGLEELLDFFHDYKISKDNIIRKYNENGQTTGEARVAFQTPRDAQRAIRELNQKPIMGRPLTLSIL